MSEPKSLEVDTAIAKLRARGYDLNNIIQAAQVVILGLMFMVLFDLRNDLRNSAAVAMKTADVANSVTIQTKTDHDRLFSAIDKLAEAQQETNYILTLSPAMREKMNVRMPDSLRRRLY